MTDSEPPNLRQGTNILRLTFGLAIGTPPEAADGLLELSTSGADALHVSVTGAPPKATYLPSKVTMQVTRGADFPFIELPCVDWGPSGDEASVRVTGPGADGVVASPDAKTVLVGASEANARLRFPKKGQGDERHVGTVSVSGWSGGPGTYTGTLQLDEDSANATAIPIEVKVRDSILWPIVVVLIGALAGGVGVRWFGLRRQRRLLHKELKAADELYRAEEDNTRPYALDDDLLGGLRQPTKRQCKNEQSRISGDFGKLYCDIHKAKNDAEFADVTARTRGVLARFSLRQDVRRELPRLRSALDFADPPANPGQPGDRSIRADTEALMVAVEWEPPLEEGRDLVVAFRQQRQLLRAYRRLADRFEGLTPAQKRNLARYQPDTLYADVPPTGAPGPSRAWPTLSVLDAAYQSLEHPDSAPEVPPGAPPEEAVQRTLALSPGMADSIMTAVGVGSRPERSSAQQVLAGLRRWDLALGLGTAALTVIAYVVGIYTDTYGGLGAYVTAFAAGFFGQAALATLASAFAQLPMFQSYRLAPAQPSA